MQANIKKCTPTNEYVIVQSNYLRLGSNKNALLWGQGCVVYFLALIYNNCP